MKKKVYSLLTVGLILCSYLILSLACASGPEPQPTMKLTINDINKYTVNQEVNELANNGLTSDQLLEVTKLCIKTGELKNVTFLEENAKLSFAILEAQVSLNNTQLVVKFSCSISKNGTVKARIIDIRELDPSNSPFSQAIYQTEYEDTCVAHRTSVLNSLKKIIDIIITRSADFA